MIENPDAHCCSHGSEHGKRISRGKVFLIPGTLIPRSMMPLYVSLIVGREPWSSGYGRRLVFRRLWA